MHFHDILRHQYLVVVFPTYTCGVTCNKTLRQYAPFLAFSHILLAQYMSHVHDAIPYLIQQEYPFSILFKTVQYYRYQHSTTPPPPPFHKKKYFCISSTSNALLISSLPGSSNSTYQNYPPPFFVLVTYSC